MECRDDNVQSAKPFETKECQTSSMDKRREKVTLISVVMHRTKGRIESNRHLFKQQNAVEM